MAPAESEAPLNAACSKVVPGLSVMSIAILTEAPIVLASTQIRHIRGDERELAGEDFRRLGEAVRGHSHFMSSVILGLLRERPFQQRLEFVVLRNKHMIDT